MKTFTVRLHADQFDRLSRRTQPVTAVAELIWNALDAESELVEVIINRTEFDAVASIVIRDRGHGMTAEEVDRDFVQLGGSWKRNRTESKNGRRRLHGRKGEGRFRAFALGRLVEWETAAEIMTGDIEVLTITGSLDTGEFSISDSQVRRSARLGTTVRISQPREQVGRLLGPRARTELLVPFVLILLRQPEITIVFDGDILDPNQLIAGSLEMPLDPEVGAGHGTPVVRVLVWNEHGASIKPSLLLCSADGAVMHENTERVPMLKDYPYTAYVLWDGFVEHAGQLELADLGDPVLSPVLEAARTRLLEHLDEIAAGRRIRIIDKWKTEKVYPFERAPQTAAEERQRAVFDLVAVTAAPAVSTKRSQAQLTLRLMREALDESPAALHRVLRDVLDLTAEQLADFDQLLNQSALGDIIKTTKLVTDRLDFLVDLQRILFDAEHRPHLLERTQLHRILETRSWVFGEEYAVVVSDKGLTKVLQGHRKVLGADPVAPVEPVVGPDGNPLIIDLFLSAVAAGLEERRHLVVELKRPKLILGLKELSQIEEYALTVTSEPQFKAEGIFWDFWLVGDELQEVALRKARQPDRVDGVFLAGNNFRVRVRTWAELLEENRRRYHFYRDHLNHRVPEDEALDATVIKYLGTPLASDRGDVNRQP